MTFKTFSKTGAYILIIFSVLGLLLNIFFTQVIGENKKNKKLLYCYDTHWNVNNPILIIINKKYIPSYTQYMNASKKHINNPIDFPLIDIPAGSEVYFIRDLNENITEVFYDGASEYNGPGVGNIFMWRDFLSDTIIPRKNDQPDVPNTGIPSLF